MIYLKYLRLIAVTLMLLEFVNQEAAITSTKRQHMSILFENTKITSTMKILAVRFQKYGSQHEYIWCQYTEGYGLEYTEWLKLDNAYVNIAHDSSLPLVGILSDCT